jgi:hypothetical protein
LVNKDPLGGLRVRNSDASASPLQPTQNIAFKNSVVRSPTAELLDAIALLAGLQTFCSASNI